MGREVAEVDLIPARGLDDDLVGEDLLAHQVAEGLQSLVGLLVRVDADDDTVRDLQSALLAEVLNAVDELAGHSLAAQVVHGILQVAARTAPAYDEQLDHYKEIFKGYLDKIDDKSAYLRQVFRRINLADSEQERKQAMEMLSDLSGYTLSMQDFSDFMNGNKQIEL